MLSIKSKAIFGLLWSFTELISKQGITLLIQIVLARLLLPEHFGLIGMITIFVAISTSIVQSGLDQALIREKEVGQRDYSTVYFFNLAIAIFIYLVIFLVSPFIASFYEEPELVAVLRVLMLIIIINAMAVIQRVILIRNIDFKVQTKITVIANITSGIIAVSLACFGAGVWSLVAQQLVTQTMTMILLTLNNKWFPSFVFDLHLFKKYFIFGYRLLLSSLIDTTYKNIYFVIIGRMYAAELLGYYTNASKLRDTSTQALSQALQRVTYPLLSQMQNEPERLKQNYQKLLKMTAYCIFPLIIGLIAIASNLIPFLLGDKWMPSVPYFQLLCVAGMLYPIHAINLNVLKVKNRSDLFLKLEIIKKLVLTVFIVISIWLNLGIEGLIYSAIASSLFALFVNTHYSAREINYSFLNQVKDMIPSLLLSIIMGIMVVLVGNFLTIHILFLLTAQVIIGVVVYVILSLLFKIKAFQIIISMLKTIKR